MGHSPTTSKIALTITFLCLSSASTCVAVPKDNLLLNGGAEQGKGGLPSFWFEAAVRADGLRMCRSTDHAYSGRFSLAISNAHKYEQTVCNNWAQNIVDAPIGKVVRLAAYIKTKDADSVNVCLQCWGLEKNMLAFASTPVVRGNQDWIVLYSEPVTVPVDTAKITVRAVLTGLGKAWFDDLTVAPVDIPTAQDEQPESALDAELLEMVEGEIIESLPVTKDCMILSYMPEWAHGNLDNIAVADIDGGVRTLVAWPQVSPEDAADPELQFLIGFYSRKTTAKGPAGTIAVYEILQDWSELTSWETQPHAAEESAVEFDFVPSGGWKLFDISTLIRDQSKGEEECYGLMLRFKEENRPRDDWSGYAFVSREGLGPWLSRRPKLLIVRKE